MSPVCSVISVHTHQYAVAPEDVLTGGTLALSDGAHTQKSLRLQYTEYRLSFSISAMNNGRTGKPAPEPNSQARTANHSRKC